MLANVRVRAWVSCVVTMVLLVQSGGGRMAAADPFASEGKPAPAVPVPVPADTFEAVVRIADCMWLDRELTRFAAALGRDPKFLRNQLAEALYHTRSFEAIDTARSAIFIWSSGASPLQAIIPIHAELRRQFVDEFGVMGSGEPPLVRVGDRDGTVIYTQNRPEGLREYRLLVIDSVAYLARNADECRRLAAHALTLLPVVGTAAPVSLQCSGAWLRNSGLLAWSWSPRLPVAQWLPGGEMLAAAQAGILSQTEQFACELRPGTGVEGRARLNWRLTARPDSEFAAWIATQQNQGSRILGLVDSPDVAFRAALHVVWQNKLEQVARSLAAQLKMTVGDGWTDAVGESWQRLFAVAQRSTDAAWVLAAPAPGVQVQTVLFEQPRADEQAQNLDRVSAALTGVNPVSVTVGGFAAIRRQMPAKAGRPALTQIFAGTNRHLLLVDGWGMAGPDLLARAEATARRLQLATAPSADPAIFSAWCNLGRLIRLAPALDTELSIPDAVLTAAVRVAGVNVLVGDVSAPLADAAAALSHLPDEPAARSR
jgi:hypothetical protein